MVFSGLDDHADNIRVVRRQVPRVDIRNVAHLFQIASDPLLFPWITLETVVVLIFNCLAISLIVIMSVILPNPVSKYKWFFCI